MRHFARAASGRPSTFCSNAAAAILANFAGRSPYLLPVQVIAPESMIGDIAEVTISGVSANSLFGDLASHRARAEPALADAEN